MVGRFFFILITVSSGISYYFFVSDYLSSKSKTSVSLILDNSLFVAKTKLKPPVVPPAPLPTTYKPVKPNIIKSKPLTSKSLTTETTPTEFPPIITPIKGTPEVQERQLQFTSETPSKRVTKKIKLLPLKLPSIPVNSYDNNVLIPLKNWQQATIVAGNVDRILIDAPELLNLNTRPLTNNDVLQISGWAGNTSLGMRMRYVLISMCKKVIGHTTILDTRPNIAETVHPNLLLSGWTAWIAVAHLPRCKDPTLQFWAMGASGSTISPITSRYRIQLPQKMIKPEQTFYTDGSPLRPKRLSKPMPIVLNILENQVNLYHCADLNCRVIGTQSKGRYLAFIADTALDWVLIQFRKSSGWLKKSSYVIESK